MLTLHRFLSAFIIAFAFALCCPASLALAADPGLALPATAELSDQKPGSILFYNLFTSSLTSPATENTEVYLTNTHPALSVAVRIWLVDGTTGISGSVRATLNANESLFFLTSDLMPGKRGYIMAAAVDADTACPVNFNHLIGEATVKFSTGHQASLAAVAVSAIADPPATCIFGSPAMLNFNGVNYNKLPRTSVLEGVGSVADGNSTYFIFNRISGSLGPGGDVNDVGSIFGVLYPDNGGTLSFAESETAPQILATLSANFPRTTPQFPVAIPSGHTGWMRFYNTSDVAMLGAAINYNANAATQIYRFVNGHNFTHQTLTSATMLIPVGWPDLAISKTHVGNFINGGTGTYNITVTNFGSGITGGTVFPIGVKDDLPFPFTLVSYGGAGWTCTGTGTRAVRCQNSTPLPAGTSLPVLTLNVAVNGGPQTVINSANIALPPGYLDFYFEDNNNNNNFIDDPTTIVCPSASVSPATIPAAWVGVAYSQSFTQSGVPGTITWSHVGNLPAGLTLSGAGVLSGTPTVAGSSTFTIKATEQFTCFAQRQYVLTVNACPSVSLTPATLPNGTVGASYSQTLTATGATPHGFTLQSGSLPAGLSLSAGGVISGLPSAVGTSSFVIRATDANGCTGTRSYSLLVNCPAININPATLPGGAVGQNYSQTLTATGDGASYTYSISAGTLPSDLSLSAGGTISGVATAPGNFRFTVRATSTNGNGCMGTREYNLTINCQTISIAPSSLPHSFVGTYYEQTLTQTGGIGNVAWTVSAGELPPGLILFASGALRGTPTTAGAYAFTVKATDANGCMGTHSYTTLTRCLISVTIAPSTLPNGTLGQAYNQTLTASGSSAPYSFSVVAGNLPPNMSLSQGGMLSGAPTGSGSFNFTVRVTDTNNCTSDQAYTLTIIPCPAIAITPGTLPAGMVIVSYSQTLTASGGALPYTYSITTGALPSGLNLSTGGQLSGTPLAAGSFSFTVKATDMNGCMGTQAYSLTIHPECSPITINPPVLPNGFAGTPYNQTLTASGGASPYTFTVSAGALPGGLNLSSGGALTGTPVANGTFNFTVQATDVNSCMGTQAYTVLISGNGLQFYPLPTPVRLLETRAGFSGCTNPGNPIAANDTFTLPARTPCAGIPANAAAITGNITVVPSAGGFLTLFPSSAIQPQVANSNFAAGEITNNVFTVGLGAGDGAFKIFTNATTHIIADVTGYYAPPGAGGLYFHPLATPVRLLETRTGFSGCFAPGTPLIGTGNPDADPNLDLALQGRSPIPSPCNSIPASAQVLVGNATSVLPGGGGYLTIYPSGGTRPTVASSNYAGSDVINGPFAVKLGADGKFKIYTISTTHLVVDILGYYSEDATDVNGAGLLFNPLPAPVRLLETRSDFPGFPLAGCTRTNAPIPGNPNAATHTQLARSFCGLPASAQALVGNVSVVNSTGAGFLTLFPGNLTTAPLVATSNYPAPATFGYNRHYFVGLGPADGTFKVLTQFTTDLILDASGYFAP